MATINWKGYTWDVRDGGTGSPGYGSWSNLNVTGPDGSGFITLKITNPTGGQPVGAELVNQTSLGYGTYTSVVQTGDMTAAQKNVVWGGMFPINNATPYIEFDAGETSKWDQDFSGVSQIDHNMWHGNVSNPSNSGSGDTQAVSADTIVTNRLIWLPGDVTFDTFAGTGTGGTLLFHSHYTANVPVPNGELVDFNLWPYASSGATQVMTSAVNYTVVVRDFTFVPPSSTNFTIKDHVEFVGTGIGTSTHMNNVANGDNLFAFISVNSSSTNRIQSVTDSANNVYHRAGSYAGTSIEVELWYALNATVNTGTTLTITPTGSGDIWSAQWVSSTGEGTVNSFDQKVGASGFGTTMNTTTSLATVKPNEILFSIVGQANNRPWNTGAGYTQIGSSANGTSAGFMTQYKVVSATGQYNATSSVDLASNWAIGLFTFADSAIASSSVSFSVSDAATTSDVPAVALAAAGGGPNVVTVQTAHANSGGNYVSTLATTFGANVSNGNGIVVMVATSSPNSGPVAAVFDSLGNSYTKLTSVVGVDGISLDLWFCNSASPGACTITANMST